jgi:transposase
MNVLKHFKKITLLTLLKNGISQHEIARKTHIDRKTIRKYQTQFESPGVAISNSPMATGFSEANARHGPPTDPRTPTATPERKLQSDSACAPHHDWIVGEVNKDRNATSIYQDLVETSVLQVATIRSNATSVG